MNKIEQAIRKMSGNQDIFVDHYNHAYSSVEEIEKMESHYSLNYKELMSRKIIYPTMKDKEVLNLFRDLRTKITSDNEKNVVMVTSLSSQSGNSFFTRNIAVATAFDASKTSILFDCSISSNGVADLFKLSKKRGVINYIFDKDVKVEDIIHDSGIKRFRVVPFGLSQQSIGEHFSHPRFQSLINQLKYKYNERYIFIDAPPILDSADAQILLNLCDQVVLLVPYGKSDIHQIHAATEVIGKEKLGGIVFNDFIQ